MKKLFKKMSKKIETPSFNKISSRIDYDKYISEKHKSRKGMIALISSFCVIGAIALTFLFDYYSVKSYNERIDKYNREYYSQTQLELKKVSSLEEINPLKLTYKKTLGERIKDSFSSIGDGLKDIIIEESTSSSIISPGSSNSFETNEQVKGINEADVSKCDGKYIYTLNSESFTIYSLAGNVIVRNKDIDLTTYSAMYIHNEDIIIVGKKKTTILEFANGLLNTTTTFEYSSYSDSRVKGDYLYLITSLGSLGSDEKVKDAYYDGYSTVDTVYSIIKYNLNDYTYTEAKNLNKGTAKLYFSENHIYLATNVFVPSTYKELSKTNFISILSIFDLELKPIAALRLKGSVLNQFSMDEYNGYIRIVTTNQSGTENHMNAISIFDLSTLKLVGQLNEGIGIGRQTVKSVRFSGDTCYIVTYENKDPLYELDLSDVTSPRIVSSYAAPGYSSYLHNFTINGEKYLFGVGVLDDQTSIKVSVYKDDDETTQIGSDFVFYPYYFFEGEKENNGIVINDTLNYQVLNNHKALFIKEDGDTLFLGMGVTLNEYFILKISVTEENVITLYKRISLKSNFAYSRCYLCNGKLYITGDGTLIIEEM